MDKIYLKWPITSNCALDCIFCNNKSQRENWPSELTLDELNKFIEFINSNERISGMTISGGEPLISKGFIEVCSKLEKKFGFITSGVGLDNLKYSPIFDNNNLDFITLSIDCLDSQIIKSIRGSDILNEQIKSLNYLIEYKKRNPKFKLFVNTVINSMNIDYVKELVVYLSNIGIDRIQLFKFYPTGNKTIDDKLALLDKDEFKITEDLINLYIDKKHLWRKKNFDFSLRFLSACKADYWEDKYSEKLPFRSKGCNIRDNTIYLKTDTRLNLCRRYRKMSNNFDLDTLKLSELNLEILIPNVFETVKEYVLNRENYRQFTPCYDCKLLHKTCNPCVELSRDNNLFVEIDECNKYLKNISNNINCYCK